MNGNSTSERHSGITWRKPGHENSACSHTVMPTTFTTKERLPESSVSTSDFEALPVQEINAVYEPFLNGG